ncbi:hypothetical protein EZS27_026833, partial [termite gut metagenome]
INTYEELLNNFKKQIEKEHRSINAYLKKEIGLTETDMEALKGLLLE